MITNTSLSPEYWIGLFLVIFSCIKGNNKILFGIAWFYLFFIALFRGLMVGTDLWGYEADYLYIQKMTDVDFIYHNRFEPGFMALIVISKRIFGFDYLTFGSLLFIPFFLGVTYFAKYRNVNRSLSLLVLFLFSFYFLAFNIMRQMMSIGIILFFVKWLYEKKYLYFAIVVIVVSYLFHRSSTIMLLMIPLKIWSSTKNNNVFPKKICICSIIISFILFFIGKKILSFVFLPLSMLFLDSAYDFYFLGDDIELGYGMIALVSTMMILIVYFHNDKNYDFDVIVSVLGVCIFNMMSIMSIFANRLAISFLIFLIIVIPVFLCSKNNIKLIVKMSIVVILLIKFLYSFHIRNDCQVNPYYFEERRIFSL